MKQILFFSLFIFASLNAYSQDAETFDDDFLNNVRNILVNSPSKKTAAEVTGTPFTTDDFVLGKVTGYQQNYLLRYDAFHDQMQVKNENDIIVIINKEAINEIIFNDGTNYAVFDYTFDGATKNGYLQVLVSNSVISLYKKEVIKFVAAKKAATGYDQAVPAAYIKSRDRYLVSNQNGEIVSFNKKKDFLKIFPDKKNELEKFIKSDKIKFSKEKDLIKLVKHINATL